MIKHQIQQRRNTFIATNPRNYAKDQKDRSMEVYADNTSVLVLLRSKTGMVSYEKWLEREGICIFDTNKWEEVPLDLENYPQDGGMVDGTRQSSMGTPSVIEYDGKNPALIKAADFYGFDQRIFRVISETGVVERDGNGFAIDFRK